MALRFLWLFILGYAIVRVKGRNPELFVNLCNRSGIGLWDVSRHGNLLVVRIFRSDLGHLRRLAHRLHPHLQVTVIRVLGLPTVAQRLLRRRFFVLGAVAFLVTLYALSSCIWFISVSGVERVSEEEIRQVVAELGLRPGVPRRRISKSELEKALVRRIDDLVWAGVSLEGTRATIRVVEKTLPNPGLNIPGDIVAKRDALVTQVLPLTGVPMVREGDTVKRGQVLISGRLSKSDPRCWELVAEGKVPYLCADGIVRGKTWYEAVGEAPLLLEQRVRTGRQCLRLYISAFARRWEFGLPRYEVYDLAPLGPRLDLRDMGLAVQLRLNRVFEVRRHMQEVEFYDALRLAEETAARYLEEEIPQTAEVVRRWKRHETLEKDGLKKVRVILTVEAKEDIGVILPADETMVDS